jgi:hypothetical protein
MKNSRMFPLIALAALLGGVYSARPDPPVIYNAMSTDQMIELRTRAWKLLPLFGKQTEGRPEPANWTTVDAIFPPKAQASAKSALGKPASRRLKSKSLMSRFTFEEPVELEGLPSNSTTPPQVVYESTFYNRKESDSIRTQRLNLRGAIDALLNDEQRDIVFPKGSVALKTFWYVLDDHTSVALWDWNKIPRDDKLASIQFDSVCVRLYPAPGSGCLDAKRYFYTLTKDASMKFAPQPNVPDVPNGQTLILVALHIVSKQMPDWLWATFWWRGDGALATHGQSWTCADAQRDAIKQDLAKMPAVWQYYSMDVDASFKIAKPLVNPAEGCGSPGKIGINEERIAVYSPFVEALMNNGRKSSCIGCHALANTGLACDFPTVPDLGFGDPKLLLPTFEMHLRTDYMWKVANNMGHSMFPGTPWPPNR